MALILLQLLMMLEPWQVAAVPADLTDAPEAAGDVDDVRWVSVGELRQFEGRHVDDRMMENGINIQSESLGLPQQHAVHDLHHVPTC